MRSLLLTLLLLFAASECRGAGRSACPVFRIGSYGGGTELWYAAYCDGPQFTTLVLSGGAAAACAMPLPPQCVGGLGGGATVRRVHPNVHKGYKTVGSVKFPNTQTVTHEAGVTVGTVEEWFVSVDDKGGGPSHAKVLRISYPKQKVTVNGRQIDVEAFRAVYGFEVASVPSGATEILGLTIEKAKNNKNITLVSFPISDSEAILSDVVMME